MYKFKNMDTGTIIFIIWITGYAANVITYLCEKKDPRSPVDPGDEFFGVILLSCGSWILFGIWMFLKYKKQPPEEKDDDDLDDFSAAKRGYYRNSNRIDPDITEKHWH